MATFMHVYNLKADRIFSRDTTLCPKHFPQPYAIPFDNYTMINLTILLIIEYPQKISSLLIIEYLQKKFQVFLLLLS